MAIGKAAVESKVMWVNTAALILGAIDFSTFSFIPNQYMPMVLSIVAAINLALRVNTQTPVTGLVTAKHEAKAKAARADAKPRTPASTGLPKPTPPLVDPKPYQPIDPDDR
jgi:hypothetical protein